MRQLSETEYWALTPPVKVIPPGLALELGARGLIWSYEDREGGWKFDLTPLGHLAVRVYDLMLSLERLPAGL